MQDLPDLLFSIHNPDKVWHEEWFEGRNHLNLPHPMRIVLLGPPNVGKTTTVKHILLRADPPFEEVFIIHSLADTQEYDDLDNCTVLENIPAPDEWQGDVKTLVILDDLEFKYLSREQKRNLDRLFGTVSTHKNISVALCSQDPFNVPAICRRCANMWVLWKMTDLNALSMCARRTGMTTKAFNQIFEKLMTEPKDSLWIDLTDHSPMKLRKNAYIPINVIKHKNGIITKNGKKIIRD